MSQMTGSDVISVVGILAAFAVVMKIFWGFVDSRAARRTHPPLAATQQSSAIGLPHLSNERIIRDYGAFVERHPPLPTRIEDASFLPHQKELIFDALFLELEQRHPDLMLDFLQVAAMSLVQFQYNVGREPLEKLGIDVAKLPVTNDLKILREQAKLMVEAESKTRDRYNEFDQLVQDDLRFVRRKIAAAESKRQR
jgi:hypothetical protein